MIVTDFALVSASLSGSFSLLSLLHGRLLVKFFFTKVADDAVAGAFSLKTTQCVLNVLVISDSNGRHILLNPPSPSALTDYRIIIAKPHVFVNFFRAQFGIFCFFISIFLLLRKIFFRLFRKPFERILQFALFSVIVVVIFD